MASSVGSGAEGAGVAAAAGATEGFGAAGGFRCRFLFMTDAPSFVAFAVWVSVSG